MDYPRELSVSSVREYMLYRGGTVTNQELVKYFKSFLTNPVNKNEARIEFKEIINQIASISRNEETGEKYLTLKRRNISVSSPSPNASIRSSSSISSQLSAPPTPSEPIYAVRQPPPYRPPPSVRPTSLCIYPSEDKTPPPVPPRRKSGDKVRYEGDENSPTGFPVSLPSNADIQKAKSVEILPSSTTEPKITVKECLQKFNRMASECSNTSGKHFHNAPHKKRMEKVGRDEEDTVSVITLDQQSKEWIVRAAQGNYQALAKLIGVNPKLAKIKDPTTGYTALHWGSKHGSQEIVKLIAGSRSVDVNCRTNGGYTPLHLALQFGHEDIFNLLVQVYGADQNLRDWSGRKPRQYQTNKDTSVSADTYRKIKTRKKNSEKDGVGFSRIGSLNVRVKQTTQAFSNFLRTSSVSSNSAKVHKSWSSADNIQDCRKMPPPKATTIKKRKSKLAIDFGKQSSPSSKSKISAPPATSDSDSDTAGFDSTWKTGP